MLDESKFYLKRLRVVCWISLLLCFFTSLLMAIAKGTCNGEFYNLFLDKEGECCKAANGVINCWCWLLECVRAEWLDVFVEWVHCLL